MRNALSTPLVLAVFVTFVSCGCACGPTLWTQEVTEEMRIELKDVARLELRTHNGGVAYTGKADAPAVAVVKVTKKGGGITLAEAKEALEAIEVRVTDSPGGAKQVGWRWKTVQKPTWGADVSYEVTAPESLAVDIQTHNGGIGVEGAAGEVRVLTHNGAVGVKSSRGPLHAETHNGAITAAYAGDKITVATHNGAVVADLSGSKGTGGEVTSHNGDIIITVGKDFSAEVDCSTYNGGVKSDVPLKVQAARRGELSGSIGQGGSKLTIGTHNGGIRIKSAP